MPRKQEIRVIVHHSGSQEEADAFIASTLCDWYVELVERALRASGLTVEEKCRFLDSLEQEIQSKGAEGTLPLRETERDSR